MAKVFQFPGSRLMAPRGDRSPKHEDQTNRDEPIDREKELDREEESEPAVHGVISFADAARTAADERKMSARSMADSLNRVEDVRTSNKDDFGNDEPFVSYMKRRQEGAPNPLSDNLLQSLGKIFETSSRWSTRTKIMQVLRGLQRGSETAIARNVAMRRQLINDFQTEELVKYLEESTESDWVANPSYYQAIIEELNGRDYQE